MASDLREGKVTLPVIYLLSRSKDGTGDLVRDVVRDRAMSPEQWQRLSRALSDHGAIDYAICKAETFAEKARQPLHAFRPSAERDALLALPDYILSRDR